MASRDEFREGLRLNTEFFGGKTLTLIARASLAAPGWTVGLALAATLLFAIAVPWIRSETSLRTFLGDGHPAVRALDRHVELFGAGYPVIVAFSCRETRLCDTALDASAVRMASAVGSELERTFGVHAVHGPAQSPILFARGDDLVTATLEGGVRDVEAGWLEARAREDPGWGRNFVSEDGLVGALVLEVSSSAADVQESVAQSLERALEPWREQGWRFHLVGELVDFVYSGPELERASSNMIPMMVAVLGLLMFALFRSLALALATLVTMGAASLWCQGAIGWLGVELNAVTTVTPSIVLAVGILDGIHVVSHYLRRSSGQQRPTLREREEAMIATAADIAPACLLTTATTGAGFLSFALSGIASFAQFGLLAAWGVAEALLLSFSLLPVLLVRLPLPADPRAARRWEVPLAGLLALVHRSGRLILLGWVALFLVGAVGLAQVKVEVQPEQLMGEDNQVMVWNRWLRENLRETESVEVTLKLSPGLSFAEPWVLSEVERLAGWLSSRERIGHPRSVLLPLAQMNQLLHGGDASFARFEDTRAGNAQLAAVVRLSDRSLIDQWVADAPTAVTGASRQHVRISLEAEPMSTASQARLVEEIRSHLRERLPSGWGFELTGSVPMYLAMMTALQASLFECFAIASITVFAVMALTWGSLRAALLAIVPTLFPVVVVVGLLGWWDFGLDPASTMVATVVLGVAVDDGIHLVSSYLNRRRAGAGSDDSLAHALRHVGPALVTSSVVLCGAFWSLTVSPVSSIANFGLLAGLSIIASLAADLVLLPACITKRVFGEIPAGSGQPG